VWMKAISVFFLGIGCDSWLSSSPLICGTVILAGSPACALAPGDGRARSRCRVREDERRRGLGAGLHKTP